MPIRCRGTPLGELDLLRMRRSKLAAGCWERDAADEHPWLSW